MSRDTTFLVLLRHADMAMHRAKATSGTMVMRFDSAMDDEANRQNQVSEAISAATE